MASAILEQDYDKDVKVDFSIWKRLFRYAFRYKKNTTILIITNILIALVDIVYPLMSKYAIDHFIAEGTTKGLPWFSALYLL